MPPNPGTPFLTISLPDKLMGRILGSLSFFTMLMTVPQVLTVWLGHQTAGVSLLSWSAYLISAVVWLWHGLRQHDRNIYLACIGWITLDGAVIVGVLLNR
jgi:uncharacterized protein with PQ loop repeat